MELTDEQKQHFAIVIDSILSVSDLTTISEKKIRKGLEEKLGRDLTDLKQAIKPLIMERFDKFSAMEDGDASPASDAHPNGDVKRSDTEAGTDDTTPARQTPKKRKHDTDSDAMLAKRLQAEENSMARPTRGSASKKTAPPPRKKTKKKSAARVNDSDELDSQGEKKEVERKGGFHKPLALSQPLANLLGETQVVKNIWKYIKANDLQDQSDKRQILCDDRLQQVFKQDKVHMFTMNRLLANQLYPIEDDTATA